MCLSSWSGNPSVKGFAVFVIDCPVCTQLKRWLVRQNCSSKARRNYFECRYRKQVFAWQLFGFFFSSQTADVAVRSHVIGGAILRILEIYVSATGVSDRRQDFICIRQYLNEHARTAQLQHIAFANRC